MESEKEDMNETAIIKAEVKKLFTHKEGISEPAWSPDGKSIAAVTGNGEIHVIDAEKGRAEKLCEGFAPAWSPGGDYIYFENQDGLWRIKSSGGAPEPLPVSDSLHAKYLPLPSPDGKNTAFKLCRVRDEVNFGPRDWFCVVGENNGQLKNLEVQCHGGYHVWSPDSELLALVVHERLCGNIHLVKADGTSEQILFEGNQQPNDFEIPGMRPAFSPNSKRIAFRDQSRTEGQDAKIEIAEFITVAEKGADGLWRRLEARSEETEHGETYDETPPFWLDNDTLLFKSADMLYKFDIAKAETTKLAELPQTVRRGVPTFVFAPQKKSGGTVTIAAETPEQDGSSLSIITINMQ